MRIIQSFWSLPAFKNEDAICNKDFTGGWLHVKYYLMSWTFSCLQLRSFYNEVELVTDWVGKSLLVDQLQLPYTRVTLELDELSQYHPELWAIGKIYAFSLQSKPFIHVDGDVFIWEKFPDRLEEAELIAQNVECDFSFYRQILHSLIEQKSYIPAVVLDSYARDTFINAYNAGIIGGNNIPFFREYVKEAIRFVDENHAYLHAIPLGMFNAVYEQHLYYCMARKLEIPVQCYTNAIDQAELNSSLKGAGQFKQAPAGHKYIHLFGEDAKKNPEICDELECKLKHRYPLHYDRVLQVVEQLEEAKIQINQNAEGSSQIAI
jgi:hypothetical protein